MAPIDTSHGHVRDEENTIQRSSTLNSTQSIELINHALLTTQASKTLVSNKVLVLESPYSSFIQFIYYTNERIRYNNKIKIKHLNKLKICIYGHIL